MANMVRKGEIVRVDLPRPVVYYPLGPARIVDKSNGDKTKTENQ